MKVTTIGIDLGTTFSCVAAIDEHGKPIVLKNDDGNPITPSVVAFEQDGNVIVGDEAKNIQSLGDANVASFFKREMGNPDFYLTFHGRQHSPTDLSAYVLAKLKADAEKVLGKSVAKAVITCPAYFSAIQREEVKNAGKLAGLDVLRVINEPTAAAVAFGIKSEKEQTLLVYDLGGGTFDVTLMKITADEIAVLATDGNHQLGGKDWDDTLRDYAVGKFQEEFAANPLEDSATANDLLVAAENVKKALSQKITTNFVIAYNGNKGRYEITREQFEDATKHLINQTLTLCESVLAAKQMDWKHIDGILLVGGSTRMPQVESELKKHTDKPILHGINVDEAVAIGAAIQADLDANEKHYTLETKQSSGKSGYTLEGRRTIKDVTGQSLGMIAENTDRSQYINTIIIPRNTNIPSCEVRPFQLRTSSRQDNEIEVYVTQGEGIIPSGCAILGKYVISGITHEKNNAVCDIEYHYDKSGTVEVCAKQRSTGKNLTVRRDEPGDMSWTDLCPKDRDPEPELIIEPVTVLIAIDTSGSMSGQAFILAQKAAKDFLSQMDLSHCSVGIIRAPHGPKSKVILPPSQNATEIVKAIDSLTDTWEGEPLFEVIKNELADIDGQRFAVILTDGQWGSEETMIRQANECHAADIQIASLGFGSVNEPFLQAIANWDMIMTSPERFSESFSKIAQVITEGKTELQRRS
ncbi:MAG: Hsp70 family protein [Planctomycetaceae bacterium]|jgi:molecular chaperone DnaK (HSP70)|nr:Hsp70 family protein [Planctomycetaceae bacterium]